MSDDRGQAGFRISLGVGDREARDWSGRLELSAGKLVRLEGWQFAGDERVEGASWTAASKKPAPVRQLNVSTPALVEPLAVLAVGVEGVAAAAPGARAVVTTPHGTFEFQPQNLAYGRPLVFLDGAAVVERQPVADRLTSLELEDDHSSVAVTRDGVVWVAWIGYRNNADHVLARALRDGRWSELVTISARGGDYFRTALAEDSAGRLWAIWSGQESGNWDLYARSLGPGANGKWSSPVRVTSNAGSDIFHSLAARRPGAAGAWPVTGQGADLALAWMSFHDGQADVYLKTWNGSRWSEQIKVSESGANDWEPSVALDSAGRVWIAWDSYERGSYNVLLRAVNGPVAGDRPGVELGELLRVTDSPRYHARASVATDAADRAWVAWEESDANWGKDWGYLATSRPWYGAGNPLYRSRSVRVALLDPRAGNRAFQTPARALMESVPAALRQYVQMPQLLSDGAGRIWALLRARTFSRTETADAWAAGGRWEVFLTAYSQNGWLQPIPFPASVARNYARAGAAIAPDGRLWAAWPSDGRLFANPPRPVPAAANLTPRALQGFGAVPQNYDVFAGSVDLGAPERTPAPAGADLVPLRADLASVVPVHAQEDEDLRRIRSYEIRSGGKTYRIYRGDMHRHTDISADGAGDGSVMDMFRYALDAARMDFAMVTDHQAGFDQEYSWWRTEKAEDLFHQPGFFTTLFGYERSLSFPNGHRNLAFAQRGVRTLPIAPGEQPQMGQVKVNSGSVLYPYLRQNRGIAFGHTSHTGMGTDWRDNDPDLEPLVEIYQGMRTSAEYEGAPKAPTADRPATHQGGYRPEGFVWNAWAKGYRIGVQASSDHVSTHISYTCLISEDRSREGLMNAMRRRHSYAATDNIILDVRMQDGAAEYIQGDAFVVETSGKPRLWVKATGTRLIKDIQVIKNNRFVYNQKPDRREVEFAFNDSETQPGQSYYYVRVVQEDGQVAWSSPIWVTYK